MRLREREKNIESSLPSSPPRMRGVEEFFHKHSWQFQLAAKPLCRLFKRLPALISSDYQSYRVPLGSIPGRVGLATGSPLTQKPRALLPPKSDRVGRTHSPNGAAQQFRKIPSRESLPPLFSSPKGGETVNGIMRGVANR